MSLQNMIISPINKIFSRPQTFRSVLVDPRFGLKISPLTRLVLRFLFILKKKIDNFEKSKFQRFGAGVTLNSCIQDGGKSLDSMKILIFKIMFNL